MTPTAVTLLLLVAWLLLLLLSRGCLRTYLGMKGTRAANSFAASGEDMDAFGKRLTRAHANCYENLPVAGVILLYAIATGQTALTDPLAYAFIGARVLQSVTHVVATSNTAVLIRFALFFIQVVILIIWLLKLFHHI